MPKGSKRRKEHNIENNIEKKHCPTCDSWKALNEYNIFIYLSIYFKS